jgi:DNA polymerase family B
MSGKPIPCDHEGISHDSHGIKWVVVGMTTNWKQPKDWHKSVATATSKKLLQWKKPEARRQLPQAPVTIPSVSKTVQLEVENPVLSPLSYQPVPIPMLLAPITELQKLAAFDFEWPNGYIDCFCLQANNGQSFKLHLQRDCKGDRTNFIAQVIDKLGEYDCITSYGLLISKEWKSSIDGDLKMLENECNELGLEKYYRSLVVRVKKIDTFRIFANETIATSLATTGSDYRTNKLDDVAFAYLGERKLEGVTGKNVGEQEPEMQVEYCLRDAQLCLKLLQKNNYELLCILYMFSLESGLDFFKLCNAYGPLKWWKAKFDMTPNYPTVPEDVKQFFDANTVIKSDGTKKGPYYEGGKVFDPVPGAYLNANTVDFSGMYPSTIDFRNICTSTIMCDCCKDDLLALIPQRVMDLINAKLNEPRPWHYWICRKKRGILSNIMHDLVARKEEYKYSGQKLNEKAVKLFANSCYGTFGQIYFKYYDVRVAEICTGFARYTQECIKKQFEDSGSQVVGGDTDSTFVSNCKNIDDVLVRARTEFGVKLSLDKQWKVLFMLPKKKQYVGILGNGELKYTTLPGLKDNNTEFCNEVTLRLINRDLLQEFTVSQQAMIDHVIEHVKNAYLEMDRRVAGNDIDFIKDKLYYSYVADRPLETYKTKGWQKELYNENLSDGSSSDAKQEYRFWKVILHEEWIKPKNKHSKGHYNIITGVSKYPERYRLNLKQIKSDIWTCVKWLLKVYGVSEDRLKRLHDELVT